MSLVEGVVHEGTVVHLEVVVVVVEVLSCIGVRGLLHEPLVRTFFLVSELQLWQFAQFVPCPPGCVGREPLYGRLEIVLERLENVCGFLPVVLQSNLVAPFDHDPFALFPNSR